MLHIAVITIIRKKTNLYFSGFQTMTQSCDKNESMTEEKKKKVAFFEVTHKELALNLCIVFVVFFKIFIGIYRKISASNSFVNVSLWENLLSTIFFLNGKNIVIYLRWCTQKCVFSVQRQSTIIYFKIFMFRVSLEFCVLSNCIFLIINAPF